MKKIVKISVAVFCLAVFADAAFAAKPGLYLGAGIGGSKLDTPSKYAYEGLPKGAVDAMKQNTDATGLAGRAFAGYNFNEYFGIEGGLAKYADSKYTGNLANTLKTSATYQYNSLDLVGKGYLPLGATNFNLYGLAGIAYVNSKLDYSVSIAGQNIGEATGHETTKKIRPIYGLGASYDIPQTNFTTNVEYSHIQGVGNTQTSTNAIPSADLVTLNFNYNFG